MSQKLFYIFLFVIFPMQLLAEDCTFEFDQENAVITGTGYKTSAKTAVEGNFPGIKLNKSEKSTDPRKLLEGLTVTVDLVSLDSGNSLRDKNLRETLFSNILGDSVVEVSVKEVGKDNIKTTMKINEKSQEITFKYSIEKDVLKASGTFDAIKFALGDQIASLKKRCGSLHTGSDGKSVTWSDFKVAVIAPLKKSCK